MCGGVPPPDPLPSLDVDKGAQGGVVAQEDEGPRFLSITGMKRCETNLPDRETAKICSRGSLACSAVTLTLG